MSNIILPAGYKPALNLYDTQRAIGTIKRLFADTLCATLNLRRVSAPLFLEAATGLNDDLNGVERKVSFEIRHRRGGAVPGQVEAESPEGLRLPCGQGLVLRHERHPPG